jgi:membrane associated rhomboid family serine protease
MTPAPVGLRCPEHSGKAQGVRKVAQQAENVTTRGGRVPHPVTIALIAVNVGIYVLELALGGSQDGTNNWIYDHGVLVASAQYSDGTLAGVSNGEWWRLMTSAFLHAGIIHLGLNMLALYWFGRLLEQIIGSWRYLLLYLASGLAGSAGALWLDPHGLSVGASGAIFGVLGALLVLERRGVISSGGQILALIVLNFFITFAIPGISRGAHIGGFIAGVIVMLLYLEFRRSSALCIASAAGVATASVVIAYAVI